FVAAAKEAFGDAGQLFVGNAGTIILDDNPAIFGRAGHTAPYDASGRRMVHCVLNQVPRSKSEQIRLDTQLDAVKIRGNLDLDTPGRIGQFVRERSQYAPRPYLTAALALVEGFNRRHIQQLPNE